MSLYMILFCSVIIFLSSFVQGVSGFGFALLAVPLLSLIITPMKNVTPIIVLYSLITNVFVVYKAWSHVRIKKMLPLMITGLFGIPLGVYLLLVFDSTVLKLIMGIIIVITSLALYNNLKVRIRNEKLSLCLVGVLSGILNGSAGLSGPPVVLFLTNQSTDKDTFRANLTFYGLITNIFAIINFAVGGILGEYTLQLVIYVLPSLIIGVLLGIKASAKISEKFFRKLTIILIAVIGIYTIVGSALQLL